MLTQLGTPKGVQAGGSKTDPAASDPRKQPQLRCVSTAGIVALARLHRTYCLRLSRNRVGPLTRHEEWTDQGLRTVQAIGDALAPGTIAAAVWEGRRYAKELEAPTGNPDTTPHHREIAALPQ